MPYLTNGARTRIGWLRQAGAFLIGFCVCGGGGNGHATEVRYLQNEPGRPFFAVDVSKSEPPINGGALKACGDRRANKRVSVCSGAEPAVEMLPIILRRFGNWQGRITKTNADFQKLSRSLAVVVDVNFKIPTYNVSGIGDNFSSPTIRDGRSTENQISANPTSREVGAFADAKMLDGASADPNQQAGECTKNSIKNCNWIVRGLLNDRPPPIFISFVIACCASAIGVALNFQDGRWKFWSGGLLIFAGLFTMIFPWWVLVLRWWI